MTRCQSLFERLEGDSRPWEDADSRARIVASVSTHLGKMLSVRAGSVQTLPDYGLPDLNDMRVSLHQSLNRARLCIQRFIEAYEPRLSLVRVTAMPRDRDPLVLAFQIEGALSIDGVPQPVFFCASLNGSGRVEVTPGVI